MAEKISTTLISPHITEFVGEPQAISEHAINRVNLSLSYLAQYNEFPADPIYDKLREESFKATHDHLTGLLNREGLDRKFVELTKHAEHNPEVHYALILLDLDGFKDINDFEGHDVGDGLLEGVAKRWAREGDILARIGGDEFVMIANTSNMGNKLRHPKSEEKATEGAVKRLKEEALKAGEELGLNFRGASAGVAKWEPGKTLEELKDEADKNMYKDKAVRRGSN